MVKNKLNMQHYLEKLKDRSHLEQPHTDGKETPWCKISSEQLIIKQLIETFLGFMESKK